MNERFSRDPCRIILTSRFSQETVFAKSTSQITTNFKFDMSINDSVVR